MSSSSCDFRVKLGYKGTGPISGPFTDTWQFSPIIDYWNVGTGIKYYRQVLAFAFCMVNRSNYLFKSVKCHNGDNWLKEQNLWTDLDLLPEEAGSSNIFSYLIAVVQNLQEGFDLKFVFKSSLTFTRPCSLFQWWSIIILDWERRSILIQFLQIKNYAIRDSLYQIQLQNWLIKK